MANDNGAPIPMTAYGFEALQGELAELSLGRIDSLFTRSEPFRRAIEGRAALLATML